MNAAGGNYTALKGVIVEQLNPELSQPLLAPFWKEHYSRKVSQPLEPFWAANLENREIGEE